MNSLSFLHDREIPARFLLKPKKAIGSDLGGLNKEITNTKEIMNGFYVNVIESIQDIKNNINSLAETTSNLHIRMNKIEKFTQSSVNQLVNNCISIYNKSLIGGDIDDIKGELINDLGTKATVDMVEHVIQTINGRNDIDKNVIQWMKLLLHKLLNEV